MGNPFTINYDVCLKLLIYCLLIACKVVVVVKFRYWVGLWDAKYGHEEYHTKLFIILMLIFFLYLTNYVFL